MGRKLIVVGSYIVAQVMDTDRIPMEGETLIGRNFRQAFGGKGSNQAVQAARLGVEVSFVGKIGADSFGRDFLGLCKKEGIESSFVFKHEQLPTASGFILCANGKNIIAIDLGAINDFTTDEIDKASVLFTPDSIILLQLEIPVKVALYAAKMAKEKGATVILNPAPATDLATFDLAFIDYLTPNETEARVCLGLSPNENLSNEEVAGKILESGCKNVIITLGDQGSLLVNREQQILVPAYEIPATVDSTGAGDAFNAGLAYALLEEEPIEKALRYANAAGGLACTRADTIPSFHSKNEIELFLKAQTD